MGTSFGPLLHGRRTTTANPAGISAQKRIETNIRRRKCYIRHIENARSTVSNLSFPEQLEVFSKIAVQVRGCWVCNLTNIKVNLRGEPEKRMRGSARARGWHASPLFDLPLNNFNTLFEDPYCLYLAYLDTFLDVDVCDVLIRWTIQ